MVDRNFSLVLTGATGYVGRSILRVCLERNIPVRALVSSEAALLHAMKWERLPAIVVAVPGRLPDVPVSLFPESRHVVVHFAVKQIDHDSSGFIKTNVEGTERLLNASNDQTLGVLYGSTLSVLGQGDQNRVPCHAPLRPETPLAESRAESENLVYTWAIENHRFAYGLRPRFILGKDDQFVLPGLAKLVTKQRGVASGNQAFSVITVDDYAEIIVSLAEQMVGNAPEQIPLNIGYSQAVSFDELLSEIGHALGIRYNPRVRIPVFSGVTRLLRRIPPVSSMATQLELVGLNHSGDIQPLRLRIGNSITDKPLAETLRSIIEQWAKTYLANENE